MCDTVIIDKREYVTVQELREVCPHIVPAPWYASLKEDACLCQVDLQATAWANSYTYEDLVWGARFRKVVAT